jgi:hypothetical protein
MPEDGPYRRRVLAGLGSGLAVILSGCGLFRPPQRTQSSTVTPTQTPTQTPTTTPTPTPTQTQTTVPRLDPGDAVSVTDVTFDVRKPTPDRDDFDDEDDDDTPTAGPDTGWAVVDADVEIRNDSDRRLRRVGLVVDVLYRSETVSRRLVVSDTVGRHWPEGWDPDEGATLSPEHLYFDRSGPPWYDLDDDNYSLRVTVRVADPV